MNWLTLLGLALIVTVIAAVTGIKANKTKPVAHTRMMGMARFILLVFAVILAYLAFRARGG